MATVLRLKGVNFNNPSLPVIAPLVRNGLRAAWRFGSAYDSLNDLSGESQKLTKIGEPDLTGKGVVGDRNNGYLTSLSETLSFTYIAVCRFPSTTEPLSTNVLMINNFTDDNSIKSGGCIWFGSNVAKGTCAWKDTVNGSSNGNNNSIISGESPVNNDWQFVVLTVDAITNTQTIYTPTIDGSLKPVTITGRNFADRVINPNHTLSLLHCPYDSWSAASQGELGEALIYDNALSTADIARQYQLSKKYWKDHRNVVI